MLEWNGSLEQSEHLEWNGLLEKGRLVEMEWSDHLSGVHQKWATRLSFTPGIQCYQNSFIYKYYNTNHHNSFISDDNIRISLCTHCAWFHEQLKF